MTGKEARVLIVGASRGIGLELAKQFSALHTGTGEVVATMRKRGSSADGMLPPQICIEILDMVKKDTVEAVAAAYSSIDTLIVNAAVGENDKLLETDEERLRWYLESNVIGLHSVVRTFLPALRRGKAKQIVLLSSTSGSLQSQLQTDAGLAGPYSVTKAASNMTAIQYHKELKKEGFTILSLHPGWVNTDMGRTAGDGGMSPETSVKGMLDVIANITPAQSGSFLNWKGETIPW